MVDDVILVGGDWNMFDFPFHIWDVILPIDFHIFQRGWNHQPDVHISQILTNSHNLIQSLHLVKKIPGVKRISTVAGFAPVPKAGKTSMKSIIFANYHSRERCLPVGLPEMDRNGGLWG